MLFSQYTNTKYGLKDLLLFFVEPLGNYWYLYILACLYLIVTMLHLTETDMRILIPLSFLACIGIGCLKNEFIGGGTLYRIIYNLFFFLIGIALAKYEKILNKRILTAATFLIVVSIWAVRFALEINVTGNPVLKPLLALATAVMILSLFKACDVVADNSFLCNCGFYCLHIYLVHPYITAGNRVFLPLLGIHEAWLSLALNTLTVLFVSLAVAMLAGRFKIFDIFFKPINIIESVAHSKREA